MASLAVRSPTATHERLARHGMAWRAAWPQGVASCAQPYSHARARLALYMAWRAAWPQVRKVTAKLKAMGQSVPTAASEGVDAGSPFTLPVPRFALNFHDRQANGRKKAPPSVSRALPCPPFAAAAPSFAAARMHRMCSPPSLPAAPPTPA